jgi:hypothetical protein
MSAVTSHLPEWLRRICLFGKNQAEYENPMRRFQSQRSAGGEQ